MREEKKSFEIKKIAAVVFIATALLCVYFGFIRDGMESVKDKNATEKTQSSLEIQINTTSQETDMPTISEQTRSVLSEEVTIPRVESTIAETMIAVDNLENLERLILNQMVYYAGDWSLYLTYLPTEMSIEINEQSMVAASLIKLYIMACFFEQGEAGSAELNPQTEKWMREMISVSDNAATNELVREMGQGDTVYGREIVNAYCLQNDFSHTQQNRDLGIDSNLQNYTSVKNTGKLLESIYREACMTNRVDVHMMDLLKDQQRRNKIPMGIPEGVVVANKTGELANIENDAAIVFSPGGDYILCIMASGLGDTAKARAQIIELSDIVYTYFNP